MIDWNFLEKTAIIVGILGFFGLNAKMIWDFFKETGHKIWDLLTKRNVRREFYRWTARWYRMLPTRWKRQERTIFGRNKN